MREVTGGGLHITIADDGKITIDGTATGAIWPDFIWGIQNNTANHNSCKYYFPKALEAVTYSIKIVNGTVTGSPSVSVMFNDDSGKNASIRLGQPQVKTATDVNGINRAFLTGVQSGTIFNNFQFYLQIESGTTATEVVPYSELDFEIDLGNIELCKIGTYQDYIYKDGDSWKVHKATATITLSGESSENWYIDQYAYMLNSVISAKPFSDIANMEAYCKSFSKSATGQTSSYAVSFWYNATGTGVRFIKDQTPDLSSFRSWLANNNQTVYYPLATATDTTITDTNLIAQLDSLVNGGAEDGTTYITVNATDPNLPGLLYVEAPKYE